MHAPAQPRVSVASSDRELFEPGEKSRRKLIRQAEHRLCARLLEPLYHLLENRFRRNTFRLGLEVKQQAMAQARDDGVVDIVVADADASREQRVNLGAQNQRLRTARTRPAAQILRDLGNRAGTAWSA